MHQKKTVSLQEMTNIVARANYMSEVIADCNAFVATRNGFIRFFRVDGPPPANFKFPLHVNLGVTQFDPKDIKPDGKYVDLVLQSTNFHGWIVYEQQQ